MHMPNFFIVGAPKAGTSSLFEYLRQHPDVFMSAVKEPSYFKPDGASTAGRPVVRTEAEYRALFDGVTYERAIGEATASYLQSAATARRLHEAVPDAKLIAILRDPVERAYSGYSMRVSQGTEHRSFADAVAPELDDAGLEGHVGRSYLRPGFYGRHLAAYLAVFPRAQLHVQLYDDLARSPDAVVRDLFGFLEVDPTFVPVFEHHNVTRHPVKHESVDRLVRHLPGKSLLRRLVPADTWARGKREVRRRNRALPPFPPELRRRLEERYRDDIRRTEELIGRDLSAWTTSVRHDA